MLTTIRQAKSVSRIPEFVFMFCVALLLSARVAVAQDVIEKTICGPGQTTTFNFADPAGMKFNVTYSVDVSGLDISPASGVVTSGQTFTVTGNATGSFNITVNYSCAEPGCTDHGSDVVHVTVNNNCPPPEFQLPGGISLGGVYDGWILHSLMNVQSPGTYMMGQVPFTAGFSADFLYEFRRTNALVKEVIRAWGTPDAPIVDAYSEGILIFMLLGNGEVYISAVTPFGITQPEYQGSLLEDGDTYNEISGDALYARGSTHVQKSDDNGKTWVMDTTGLNGAYLYSLAVDTAGTVFLATSTGLMSQGAKSALWQPVSSFGTSSAAKVFVDYKDRLFASTYTGMKSSIDHGATWSVDSAGMGAAAATSIGGDALGNIYAVTNYGSRAWRSRGGTQPWERIDMPITSQSADYNQYQSVIKRVEGDTTIFATTMYGLYQSTDQGTTWMVVNSNTPTTSAFGIVREPSSALLVSTNTGIHSKKPGDSLWKHVFPPNAFIKGAPLFRDDAGNLYSQGAPVDPTSFSGVKAPFMSTDGGTTWNIDTLGFSIVKSTGFYFVDETGTQHYATAGGLFYAKPRGASWTSDSAGYSYHSGDSPNGFGTDRHGFVYFILNKYNSATNSSVGQVWKRPVAGGAWAPDTTGLPATTVWTLAADRSGALLAGTYGSGLWKESGGHWSPMPSPNGGAGNTVFTATSDSSGRILAAFSDYSSSSYTAHGVYATTNNGTTWTLVSASNLSPNAMVSYGDTTYAVTGRGVTVLTGTAPTSVTEETSSAIVPRAMGICSYPNPSSSTTTLAFATALGGHVRVEITDMVGRVVATPVNTELAQGGHAIAFDTHGLIEGVYACRIVSPGNSAQGMLVVKR